MLRATLIGVLALAGVTGCSRSVGSRAPDLRASQPYLATRMCAFHVDTRTQEAQLRVELTVIRPLPPGSLIEMRFENPAAPNAPLTATRVATGTEKILHMVSPPMPDIRMRSYETVAQVYSGPDRKQTLGTHVQTCQSPFDQRDLGPQFR